MLISSTVQGPAADLAAAAAAPQHGGHPALLPAGALLRPPQHAPAPHHEARQLQVIFTFILKQTCLDLDDLLSPVTARWSLTWS